MKVKSEVAQSCPTLSDPMDCSPSGSSVHGIRQARVLEWGAIADSSNSKAFASNHQEHKNKVTIAAKRARLFELLIAKAQDEEYYWLSAA